MPAHVPGPVDLEAVLAGGQTFVWDRVDGGWEGVVDGRLVRAWSEDGEVLVEGLPKDEARAYFRADDDHEQIRARLAKDPVVAKRLRRWPGLRVLRTRPWPCLVSFILSQNSNIPRITRNLRDLSRELGPAVDGRHDVPPPDALVDAGEARLRDLGVGYRAPYLVGTAERVADGEVDLETLREAPYHDARDALMELPGVGPKVAECVLLFGLDEPSAFPVDRWVARSLAELYPSAPAAPDPARRFARDRFGPDAGYAQQFLFWDRREAGR